MVIHINNLLLHFHVSYRAQFLPMLLYMENKKVYCFVIS